MLGDHLQLLLRSVLSKMQSVRTASVMQSLLIVYAYLLQTEVHSHTSHLHASVGTVFIPFHSLKQWSHSCVRFQIQVDNLL